jgi:hypothetical protein
MDGRADRRPGPKPDQNGGGNGAIGGAMECETG